MNAITILSTAIRQLDGLYCLNDLHTAAGAEPRHRPSRWLENQQTQELAQEIETAGIPAVKTKEGRNGGTYVCRELVYAYAMWISPKFNLAVIRAFDALATAPAKPQADKARNKAINRRAWALAQADYARYQALMQQALPAEVDAHAIHAWMPPAMLPAARVAEAMALLQGA